MNTFVFCNETGQNLGHANTVEEVIQFLRDNAELDKVVIGISLGTPLHARVKRSDTNAYGVVILQIGELEREFTRNTQDTPDGDLSVSCPPLAGEVPVMTINIPFRAYEDPAVCKDMVFVTPGNEAQAHITLFPPALEHANENIEEIIAAARKAVQGAVFDRMVA